MSEKPEPVNPLRIVDMEAIDGELKVSIEHIPSGEIGWVTLIGAQE